MIKVKDVINIAIFQKKMYRACDQRYSYFRNLGYFTSLGASSSSVHSIFSMWDQE